MIARRIAWTLAASLVLGAALSSSGGAAPNYPPPTFSQALAGMNHGGTGLQSVGCVPNPDLVTCAFDVNIVSGGGGGGSSGANGAPGTAGATAQYIQGVAGGVPVPVSGSFGTTFPYTSAAAQAPTAASFLGIAGFDGTNVEPIKTSATGVVSTLDANGGAQATGITPPTGGSGILGFLSGIYTRLANIGLLNFGGTGGTSLLVHNDTTAAYDPSTTTAPGATTAATTAFQVDWTGTAQVRALADSSGDSFMTLAPTSIGGSNTNALFVQQATGSPGGAAANPSFSTLIGGSTGASNAANIAPYQSDALSPATPKLDTAANLYAFDGGVLNRVNDDADAATGALSSSGSLHTAPGPQATLAIPSGTATGCYSLEITKNTGVTTSHIYAVSSIATSAQAATIQIFAGSNEGATPTCAVADAVTQAFPIPGGATPQASVVTIGHPNGGLPIQNSAAYQIGGAATTARALILAN